MPCPHNTGEKSQQRLPPGFTHRGRGPHQGARAQRTAEPGAAPPLVRVPQHCCHGHQRRGKMQENGAWASDPAVLTVALTLHPHYFHPDLRPARAPPGTSRLGMTLREAPPLHLQVGHGEEGATPSSLLPGRSWAGWDVLPASPAGTWAPVPSVHPTLRAKC